MCCLPLGLPTLPRRSAAAVGLALVVAAVAATPSVARAQAYDLADEADVDQPAWLRLGPAPASAARAVQRRKYALRHEVDLLFGGLPVDPLVKAVTATVGYAFHFNHYVAWELVRLSVPFSYDTQLKRQLALSELSGIGPRIREVLGQRDVVQGFVSSRLAVKPLYGKEAFLDRGLLHLEIFVAAGPSLLRLRNAFDPTVHRLAGGLDVGLNLRVWVSRHVSVRGELADVLLLAPRLGHALHANGGLSLSFGGEA